MADREITERVRIDVEGRRELRDAAAAARGLKTSLETVVGGARSANTSLHAVAQGAAAMGRTGGPTSLEQQLESAEGGAVGLAQALSRARAETERLQRSDLAARRSTGRATQALNQGLPLGPLGPAQPVQRFTSPTFAAGADTAAMAGVAVAMAAAAAALGAMAARLTVAGIRLAIGAVDFKQSTLRSFELLTRSRKEAERLFQVGSDLAVTLGQAPESTLKALQTLMARGFQAEGATGAINVLKAMADLKEISPSANVDNLITAIAQIKSKGKLALEELQGQLGEQFDVSAVIDQLSKKLGKSGDEVRKLISAGKIDADTGILAVLDAIKAKTGKDLGKAAEEGASGIQRLVQTIIGAGEQKGLIGKMFEDIDLGPLRDMLKSVVGFLSGSGGDKLKAAITKTGSGLIDTLFGGFSGPEGAKRIEALGAGLTRIFEHLGAFFEAAAPVAKTFFDGMFIILEKLGGGDSSAGMMLIVDGLMQAVTVSTQFLQLIMAIVDAIRGAREAIGSLTGSLTGLLSTEGVGIGGNLSAGIAQGILGGQSAAINAVMTLAGNVTNAATSAFRISSPSRVFAELGGQLSAGLGQGAVANDNAATTALQDVAGRTTEAAQGGIASAATPAGGGGAPTVNITINMTPAAGASPAETRAHAEAAVSGAGESIQRFFRRRAEAA